MKKRLFIFVLLLLLFSSVSAQENGSQKLYELDPFSECEFLRSKLDIFFVNIQDTPDSIGFIIYYEGKYSSKIYNEYSNRLYNRKKVPKTMNNTYLPRIGEVNIHLQIMRDLIKRRNFSPDKILFVNGGYRENFKVEFWLVPKGAELPTPTPTFETMEYIKGKPSWSCEQTF